MRESKPCRSVTAEEVDHLHELGWVKLDGFVDPGIVQCMLDRAREVMGDDADSNPISPFLEAAVADGFLAEKPQVIRIERE